MDTASEERLLVAEDLWSLGPGHEHCELDEGRLIDMTPAGPRHGKIAMRLGRRLADFVEAHRLGDVYAAETGFQLARNVVRAPDVSFVRAERLPAEGLPERGFFPGAPDLAVEVLSPVEWEHPGAVARKIAQYLEAGAALVWIVDPRARHVLIYKPDNTVEFVGPDATLRGEPLLPGFECDLRELFPPAPQT